MLEQTNTIFIVPFLVVRSGLCKLWSVPDCEPIAVLRGTTCMINVVMCFGYFQTFSTINGLESAISNN